MQNKLNAIYGGNAPTPPVELAVEEDEEEKDTDVLDMVTDGLNGTDGNSTAEPEEDVVKPPMPPWYLPNPWAVR